MARSCGGEPGHCVEGWFRIRQKQQEGASSKDVLQVGSEPIAALLAAVEGVGDFGAIFGMEISSECGYDGFLWEVLVDQDVLDSKLFGWAPLLPSFAHRI